MGTRTARLIAWVAIGSLLSIVPVAIQHTLAAPTSFDAVPSTLGTIPDGLGVTFQGEDEEDATSSVPSSGPPRDVQFNVTGLTGTIDDVSVSMSMTHNFLGDLDVRLIAPGGSPEFVIFSRTGAIANGGADLDTYGAPWTLSGEYGFGDAAPINWWSAASDTAEELPVPPGSYRTTAAGGPGRTRPAPVTELSGAFAAVANPNGTWTLRFRDVATDDVGSVTAASLIIDTVPPGDTDQDGIENNIDECPSTPANDPVGPDGCPPDPNDGDADDVDNVLDLCANTPVTEAPASNGCSASQYQPDATIRKSGTTAVIGDGTRNANASGQTILAKVKRRKSVTYEIVVQNENAGPVGDDYTITGCRSSRGFTVTYFDGGANITNHLATGYTLGPIAQGASDSIFLKIKVRRTGPRNKTCLLRVASQGSPGTSIDTVAGNVKVKPS